MPGNLLSRRDLAVKTSRKSKPCLMDFIFQCDEKCPWEGMEGSTCRAREFQEAAKQGLEVMFQYMCPPGETDPKLGSGMQKVLAPINTRDDE